MRGRRLNVSDAGTVTNSRLGGRAVNARSAPTFNYTVNSGGASARETVGALTLSAGQNTINVNNPGSQSDTLTFASLTQTAVGNTVNYTGALGTAANKIIFSTAPTLVPATTGILARETVNGVDFAAHNNTGNGTANTFGIQAYSLLQ